MSDNSLFPLPEADSSGVCKRLGVVLGNAAMYGMQHTVTATAQAAAYDSLVGLLDLYGEMEWAMSPDGLLLNGKPIDSKGMAQTLVEQMRRSNVQNFAFCPPLDRREFATFLAILSAEPGSAIISDGVDAALVKAGFKSIRVDKAVYSRVSSKSIAVAAKPAIAPAPGRPAAATVAGVKKADTSKGRVFDLDSEFMGMDDQGLMGGADGLASSGLDMAALAQTAHYIEQRSEVRKQHLAMLKLVRDSADDAGRLEQIRQEMLTAGFQEREWEVLLDESGVNARPSRRSPDASVAVLLERVGQLAAQQDSAEGGTRDMRHALEAIGQEVDALIRHTQGQTATLAQRVEADRNTVAEMESQARARGVGLALSRVELLDSLAEINQELMQPLTTSSALLQLIRSGKTGAISDSQRELLDTAAEGMERLETLVAYLQRISGFPVALSPDHTLLSEVYDNR